MRMNMLPIEHGYCLYREGVITYAEYRRDYADPVEKVRAEQRAKFYKENRYGL